MNPFRELLRSFDHWLSRQYRVQMFTQDPGCILRIQFSQLPETLDLSDRRIEAGASCLMIHLWNERSPLIPAEGPTLAWALDTSRRMHHSLSLIAQYIQNDPACGGIRAVGGVTGHVALNGADGGRTMLEHLGFMVIPYHRPFGAFGEFWENFYTWWVMWTFNPASTQHRSMFHLQRTEFWMSRQAFLARYVGLLPAGNISLAREEELVQSNPRPTPGQPGKI